MDGTFGSTRAAEELHYRQCIKDSDSVRLCGYFWLHQ